MPDAMTSAWTMPIGWVGLTAMLISWTMAAIVFRIAPGRRQNRALAAFLLVGSIVHGIGQGILYLVDDHDIAYGLQVMSVAFAVASGAAYVWFLSTLETPLTRPLRSPIVLGLLAAACIAWLLAVVLRPTLFVTDVLGPFHYPYAKWEGATTNSFMMAYLITDGACGLLGLAASAFLVRGSRPGTEARRKAWFYALAFVVYDLFVALTIAVYNYIANSGAPLGVLEPGLWLSNLGFIAFVLLLGYGILRAQLFDIDLRIKVAVSRGTVYALLLGTFLVVEQIVQNLLSTMWGLLWGGVAAGLLLFAIHPLQRLSDRFANRAMPNVQASPKYVQRRKADVYRDAVESLLTDGVLTRKERALLDQLRSKLDLDLGVAADIERQAWAQLTA